MRAFLNIWVPKGPHFDNFKKTRVLIPIHPDEGHHFTQDFDKIKPPLHVGAVGHITHL